VSAAEMIEAEAPATAANQPDAKLAPAVAANEAGVPRCPPGSVRVVIRPPEDATAATVSMKNFVQGFARIAVKHLQAANESRAPIDLARAP
jgi:hypothetical protein